MSDIQEKPFQVASALLEQKEQAYKEAIDFYFKGIEWNESFLEEFACINVEADGSEIFLLGDMKLLKFGPLESNVVIDGGRVLIQFKQDIEKFF